MVVLYTRELLAEAMKLWRLNALQYRTLLLKYKMLERVKREEKIRPLRSLSKAKLREYPEIEFFRIIDRHEAEEYLLDMSCFEVEVLVKKIRDYLRSPLKMTLESRVVDFEREIKNHGVRFSPLAMNPDACGNGKHYGSRRAPLMANEW